MTLGGNHHDMIDRPAGKSHLKQPGMPGTIWNAPIRQMILQTVVAPVNAIVREGFKHQAGSIADIAAGQSRQPILR